MAFDLARTPSGVLAISNTQGRIDDLQERIDSLLRLGMVSGKEAKSLRSRLNFAEGQLYGRTMAAVLKDLGRYESSRTPRRLDDCSVKLLEVMKAHLSSGFSGDPR